MSGCIIGQMEPGLKIGGKMKRVIEALDMVLDQKDSELAGLETEIRYLENGIINAEANQEIAHYLMESIDNEMMSSNKKMSEADAKMVALRSQRKKIGQQLKSDVECIKLLKEKRDELLEIKEDIEADIKEIQLFLNSHNAYIIKNINSKSDTNAISDLFSSIISGVSVSSRGSGIAFNLNVK